MIKFKDFMSAYESELWTRDSDNQKAEPIEIWFEQEKYLFTIDCHEGNIEDLKKFVSKKVFESYVEKIWLEQKTGRIGITLTNEDK